MSAYTIAIALGAHVSASAAPSPVEGHWTKPRTAVENVGRAASPVLYAGPGRYAIILWGGRRGGDPANLIAVREPGERDFGKPERIGPPTADLRLEMGLGGDTLLTWYDQESERVMAMTRTPQQDWSEPLELGSTVNDEDALFLSVAPDGGMTVIWGAINGDDSLRMDGALRPPGGEFGEPVTIVEDWDYHQFADVFLANGLNGAVVWRADCDIFNPELQLNTGMVLLSDGTFGPPGEIPESACPHTRFSLAMDNSGRTLATVNGFDFTFLVKLAVREPGGEFGPAEKLNSPGEQAFHAVLATTPSGENVVMWKRIVGGHPAGVRAALGDPSGFGPARVIAGGNTLPESGQGLAMNASGDAAVLAIKIEPKQRLLGIYREGTESRFRAPEYVSDPLGSLRLADAAVSISENGRPIVVWMTRSENREKGRTFLFSERRR